MTSSIKEIVAWPWLGRVYKRAHVRKLFQSLDGWEGKRSPGEGLAADPN